MLSTIYSLSPQKIVQTRDELKGQDRNPPCPIIFLDIQKAFDRVWSPLLLQRLEEAGIHGKAWRWINSFLSHRKIRVIDKSLTSNWQDIHYGVPQGCVLSPMLFLVFINSISKTITRNCPLVSPLLYADDKALAPNIGNPKILHYIPYLRQLPKALDLLHAMVPVTLEWHSAKGRPTLSSFVVNND